VPCAGLLPRRTPSGRSPFPSTVAGHHLSTFAFLRLHVNLSQRRSSGVPLTHPGNRQPSTPALSVAEGVNCQLPVARRGPPGQPPKTADFHLDPVLFASWGGHFTRLFSTQKPSSYWIPTSAIGSKPELFLVVLDSCASEGLFRGFSMTHGVGAARQARAFPGYNSPELNPDPKPGA
jgi:hypothetical protein